MKKIFFCHLALLCSRTTLQNLHFSQVPDLSLPPQQMTFPLPQLENRSPQRQVSGLPITKPDETEVVALSHAGRPFPFTRAQGPLFSCPPSSLSFFLLSSLKHAQTMTILENNPFLTHFALHLFSPSLPHFSQELPAVCLHLTTSFFPRKHSHLAFSPGKEEEWNQSATCLQRLNPEVVHAISAHTLLARTWSHKHLAAREAGKCSLYLASMCPLTLGGLGN